MNAVPTGNNVRHIPIFVEGRPEPIFNTNLSQAVPPAAAEPASPLPKPSDYYPAGVQRIRPGGEAVEPHTADGRSRTQLVQEPTTPLGPPPGPIPMGYLPSGPPPEPTTPMGPPPGPIPMGFHLTSPLAPPDGPIPLPCDPNMVATQDVQDGGEGEGRGVGAGGWVAPPAPPTRTSASNIQNVPEPPVILNPPNNSQKSNQPPPPPPPAAEPEPPVVNFIPIKVEHGQPTASPQSRSRPSSQEYHQPPPPKSGKSPTPVEKNPSPTPPAAKPAPETKDPKISKLDTIMESVEGLRAKIDAFTGSRKDKEYLYLDDALTKHLCSLDCIEADGREDVRQLRKESINKVSMGYIGGVKLKENI